MTNLLENKIDLNKEKRVKKNGTYALTNIGVQISVHL